jgi:hypothetical protein
MEQTMIFSKANLAIVDIVKADKNIPALDNLHLRADGTTIAANGSCLLAVSPVEPDDAKRVPLFATSMFGSETVNSDTIREVVKGMPRDTLFAGTLEHCDYSSGKFTLTDGKRHRSISARTYPRDYIKYQDILSRVGSAKSEYKCAVNLRRLVDVLSAIDKIFVDTSKNLPVYLEFTSENDVIVRCLDVKGKQRCVGILRSYVGAESKWLPVDMWENRLFTSEKEKEKTACDSKENASVNRPKIAKKKKTSN